MTPDLKMTSDDPTKHDKIFLKQKKVNTYKSDITFPVWYVMYAVFACYTMLAVREDHALYGAVLLTVRVNSMKKICFKN